MSIKFLKIRDVKSPSRANSTDAGIDFYVPVFNDQFKSDLIDKNQFLTKSPKFRNGKLITNGKLIKSLDKIPFDIDENGSYFELQSLERILIPSGIKYQMDVVMGFNKALIAFNKSGVSTKLGLIVGATICDIAYQGEVHISLINASDKTVRIYENQKIVQFIEMPVYSSIIEFVENEEELFNGIQTDRGSDGFGSTNHI